MAAVKTLRPIRKTFDAIVVTGNSGTIFGGALSLRLNKPLILVRKPEDSSHATSLVEGWYKAKTYLFVDDLIDTGTTRNRVLDAMVRARPGMKHVGTYLWSSDRYRNSQ